jgi:hypothetical protein
MWVELLWCVRTRELMLPIVVALPMREGTAGSQDTAECVHGGHYRQQDQ